MNALEEMRDGGELSLSLACRAGELRIDVGDIGGGVPEHIQARLFDPYFTTKAAGSGMGLAVCDKMIQQHDGRLDFKTSSAGTVFHIWLPLSREKCKTTASES